MVDIEVDADNRPTNGEQILERQLDQCKPELHFPQSNNEHSSDNKRHYISWGGVRILTQMHVPSEVSVTS